MHTLTKYKQLNNIFFRLVHSNNKYYHSKELFKFCEILSFYKINLLSAAVFMHKINTELLHYHFLKNMINLFIHIQHVFQ